MPFRLVLGTPDQRGGEDVMTVAKNIRPHVDDFVRDAFNCITAAIYTRENVLDMKSRSGRVNWR